MVAARLATRMTGTARGCPSRDWSSALSIPAVAPWSASVSAAATRYAGSANGRSVQPKTVLKNAADRSRSGLLIST